MSFSFHRIPVGICNCYLLQGERIILVAVGAQGRFSTFQYELQKLNIDPKEIENFK